jgi:hypothetical protein
MSTEEDEREPGTHEPPICISLLGGVRVRGLSIGNSNALFKPDRPW